MTIMEPVNTTADPYNTASRRGSVLKPVRMMNKAGNPVPAAIVIRPMSRKAPGGAAWGDRWRHTPPPEITR